MVAAAQWTLSDFSSARPSVKQAPAGQGNSGNQGPYGARDFAAGGGAEQLPFSHVEPRCVGGQAGCILECTVSITGSFSLC